MKAASKEEGGAGGRPPFSTAQTDLQHPNDGDHQAQEWRVVVCTREAVWGRYPTRLEAQLNVCQLRGRGLTAWVEADQ